MLLGWDVIKADAGTGVEGFFAGSDELAVEVDLGAGGAFVNGLGQLLQAGEFW